LGPTLDKFDAIGSILTSNGCTLVQGALAWLLMRCPRTIPIPGYRNLKQAQENVETLQKGLLTAEQMQEIEILLERS